MDRRQGLLGYLAVGLGVVALIVALGGRFGGQYQRSGPWGNYRERALPQAAQQQSGPAAQAPAVPQAPVAPQAQPQPNDPREPLEGRGRHAMQGWERQEGFGRERRGPLGFLGGLFPLLGALLLMGLGLRLFRGQGGNWRGNSGRWQHGHGPWNGPQGGQPQGGQPQAGPQAPPPHEPPHTGETRRFDA